MKVAKKSKKVDGAFYKFYILFNKNCVSKENHQKMRQLCFDKFNNWKKAKERFSGRRDDVKTARIITKIEVKQ